MLRLHKESEDWRDSAAVKSIDFSLWGPIFESQHLQGSFQWSVATFPEDLIASSGLHRHPACIQHTHAKKKKKKHPYTWKSVNLKRGGELDLIAPHIFPSTQKSGLAQIQSQLEN